MCEWFLVKTLVALLWLQHVTQLQWFTLNRVIKASFLRSTHSKSYPPSEWSVCTIGNSLS